MTVVGIDDTDSRSDGLCTTYVGARISERIRESGASVERSLLIRLNPAVPYKTRGNAAVAIHTDADPDVAFDVAGEVIDRLGQVDDPNTEPGLVVAPHRPSEIPDDIGEFTREGIREFVAIEAATRLVDDHRLRHRRWNGGRGIIGALAAVGAWVGLGEWTYEAIAYRQPDRWGTPRTVDASSVFSAADGGYPAVWDSVDRTTGDLVCVPRTPCPVLFGIRGDDPESVLTVASEIDGEPVERTVRFVTNQGTDGHLREGTIATVTDGRSYRLNAFVARPPETREGGHVFVDLVDDTGRIRAAAFEPTKHFRSIVRRLRPGDQVTACGEVSDGTIKLEKVAIRSLVTTESVNPTCPNCGRSMESAGRDQGFRCRRCGTAADSRDEQPIDRDLEPGWYEVPPCARRHIAKPLVRGGFDAPVYPER